MGFWLFDVCGEHAIDKLFGIKLVPTLAMFNVSHIIFTYQVPLSFMCNVIDKIMEACMGTRLRFHNENFLILVYRSCSTKTCAEEADIVEGDTVVQCWSVTGT